jgi:hypothetical protein
MHREILCYFNLCTFIFYYMYNEQTNAHLIDSFIMLFFIISLLHESTPTLHAVAWTRLCNLASTEWELPEDEALALKHVGSI